MSPSIKRIEIYLHACVKKLGNEVLWWQPLGRAWVGYGSAVQGLYHCDFMRNLPVWACWQVRKEPDMLKEYLLAVSGNTELKTSKGVALG